jgi:hypothetical protein
MLFKLDKFVIFYPKFYSVEYLLETLVRHRRARIDVGLQVKFLLT